MHPTVSSAPRQTIAAIASAAVDDSAIGALRSLRASTMIRMTADRLHRGFVDGTLDERERAAVDRAIVTFGRSDAATSTRRLQAVVAAATTDLGVALDANDHIAGQFLVTFAGAAMAAMAIRTDLEVGALSPF